MLSDRTHGLMSSTGDAARRTSANLRGRTPAACQWVLEVDRRGIAPPGYYERFYSGRSWRFYLWLLSTIVQRSDPGPIVDLGAGTGLFVEAADRWGLDCIGVEASGEGIAAARERHHSIRMVHSNIREPLPFDDASFATVLLNQVIEHLEPDVAQRVVSEAYRVLKPGGMLMIMSPSRFNDAEWRADPTHVCLYSPSELRRVVTSHGFGRFEAMNSPLPLLGEGPIRRRLMRLLWWLMPLERFSASANCIAFKLHG